MEFPTIQSLFIHNNKKERNEDEVLVINLEFLRRFESESAKLR